MATLLLVDPDAKLAASLGTLFKHQGFESHAVTTAEQALDALPVVPVDLLVTEVHLPGTDGFELVRSARRLVPGLPFVILTSAESFEYAREAMRLGARNYLVKHVDRIDLLVQSIENVLVELRAEREERELLQQISLLHEDFLRNLIHLERENAELHERLGGPPVVEPSGYRVLVVDDEPLVCGVLRDLLVESGFHVDMAQTGEQALALLGAGGFDLVLADKNLPSMNGLELLRRVKEHNPEVEVLIMTGYASIDSAIQAIDFGAAGYILKPFDDLQEVLAKIRDVRQKQEFRVRAARFLDRFKTRNRELIERYQEVRRRLGEHQARLGGQSA